MKLLVEPLRTTITYNGDATGRILARNIRPRIYKAGSPAGTLTLTVKQSGDTLGTASLTLAAIETGIGSSDYFHGVINFAFSQDVVINKGAFTVELSASGYTFSESAHYGWIADFEDPVNALEGSVNNVTDKPFSFEIWEMKRI